MSSLRALPSLAFGQKQALQFSSAEQMSETLARGGALVMNHRSTEPDGFFSARSAVIRTRNIRLVALASSAFHVEARESATGLLMIPWSGSTATQTDGRTYEWGEREGALYLPPGGCRANSTARSVVGIDIDPGAFKRVAEAMLGGRAPRQGALFDFAAPRPVALHGNDLDFGKVFKAAIATLDLLGGDINLIEKASLDDVLLRIVALLFNFEELSVADPDKGVQRAVVQLACDYIDDNLTNTIALTDLELLTGLSRRSLQYAFRATFDCTPMQWVAQRRLEAVRSQILAARHGANLTTIAGEYFTNLGEFARMYRRRYGELPSATLKAAITKRLRS